jgi:hydroxyacylglutathione hydrolase
LKNKKRNENPSVQFGRAPGKLFLLEQGREALLIDPADDASFILEEIQRRNLTLVGMLATHGHFDHIMAVGEIQMAYAGVETHCNASLPLYIHPKDQFLIDRLESTAEHFLGYKPIIIKPKTIAYLSTDKLQVSSYKLQVVSTPGHTPGSVCFYFPDEQVVFTGDTLFAGAVGRTDLSYSSKSDLRNSLKTLFALPEETVVYPGHGEETYVGEEKGILE